MIKGKDVAKAAEIAQSVYSEFRAGDWPGGGSDVELQQFIMTYNF